MDSICHGLRKPHILVSVRDSHKQGMGNGNRKPFLRPCEYRLGTHYTIFDDVSARGGLGPYDCTYADPLDNPITPEQAESIAAFVKKHFDKAEVIVCQCFAGISRSSAIAAAIADYYNIESEDYFGSADYAPNILVYNLVLNALENNANDSSIK